MALQGQMKVQANLPEKKFRVGQITATIWKNENRTKEGNTIVNKTVTFGKNYKDKEGRWKTTNTLSMNDVPKAILVLNKAYEHMALTENSDVEIQLH